MFFDFWIFLCGQLINLEVTLNIKLYPFCYPNSQGSASDYWWEATFLSPFPSNTHGEVVCTPTCVLLNSIVVIEFKL